MNLRLSIVNDCPCDLQCREECDICRDTDTMKIGEQRMEIPRENSERVKMILADDTTMEEKASAIHSYDVMCLSREYDRRKPKPEMTERQILAVLIERVR